MQLGHGRMHLQGDPRKFRCARCALKTLSFFPDQNMYFFLSYFRPDSRFETVVQTTLQTRVHKPYPLSDQNGQNLHPISEWLMNRTLCHPTYLYSNIKLYKEETSSPPHHPGEYVQFRNHLNHQLLHGNPALIE